jgi:hypothetical protein
VVGVAGVQSEVRAEVKRAFSFGGGRQSTAALVLAAQGKLDVDCFVFANVGDDSENPDTLAYVENYSKPYAREHGLELVEVQRKFRDGRDPSLWKYVHNEQKAIAIPVRMESGAPGTRKCTYDWKIRVVARYLKQTRKWSPPWEVLLGISWDESHRITDADTEIDGIKYVKSWPLCDMRLTVGDCKRIVAEAGLPEPPKSSCWFCPFHDLKGWAKLRLNRPDLFEQVVQLERKVSARHEAIGRGPVWMTNRLKPLDVAVPEGAEQLEMFDTDDACSSGYCWT